MAYIFVNVNRSVGTINPTFTVSFRSIWPLHLSGIYVGQASDIPNTNGMRNDVVSALKALHVPCCVGRAAALPIPITGATALAPRRTAKPL